MDDFLTSGAILQIASNRYLLAKGPFEENSTRISNRLAFFVPDFFLDDLTPWKHPASYDEVDKKEILSLLQDFSSPHVNIVWSAPNPSLFRELFFDLQKNIAADILQKAVPLAFEEGLLRDNHPALITTLVKKSLELPSTLSVYGFWNKKSGIFGATPEILFAQSDAAHITTVALAGTSKNGKGAALKNSKEQQEHQYVLHDLQNVLSSHGSIEFGPTSVCTIPMLSHLKTGIFVKLHHPLNFETIIRIMHPTAALGAMPREACMKWLRYQESLFPRGLFGAPFGIEWPDQKRKCFVAIRNVMWKERQIKLGAGCGVIAESHVDDEWNEILLKQRSVK